MSTRSKKQVAFDFEGADPVSNESAVSNSTTMSSATTEATRPDARPVSSVGAAAPPYAMPVRALPALLVRASAGTGKTYRLTGRLLNLLMQGAPIESILATTFTRKAAGEILERVLTTLARAASDESERALGDLRSQIGDSEVTRIQCVKLLHAVVREIHRLRIGTLDSLFSQLARSFPFELGLPPGWRLTDENEERWLRSRAIDTMLAASEPGEVASLLSMLTKGEIKRSIGREIEAVVLNTYAIARACSPHAWESLQPPTAPPQEELTRAAGYLLTAAIGNKSADRILQKIGQFVEGQDAKSVAEQNLVFTAKRWQTTGEAPLYYRKEVPSDVVEALLVAFDYARSSTLGLLDEQSKATGQILQNYDRTITHLKHAVRALAFDDVSVRLADWVSGEQLDSIAYRLDGVIDHVLLDEFQDTSPQQWQVLRPLAHRAVLAAGKAAEARSRVPATFFCVGDTKQAIYGWRGGVAAIFDSVDQQIPGVAQENMSLSFRSSPVITQAVTDIFQNLTRHPLCDHAGQVDTDPAEQAPYEADAVVDFAQAFPEHQSSRNDLPGYVCLQAGPTCEGSSADKAILLHRYVANQVADLAARMPGRSIGILTRSNATVGRLIYLLRQRDVEVSQEGGNPLIDSGAVELMLSVLMLSEHPGDGRWWYHIQHSPLVQHPLFVDLVDTPAGSKPTSFTAAARVRRLLEHQGLVATIRDLGQPIADACDAGDCLRLRQLLQLAHQFELNPQPRLCDFVDQVRQQRVERPQPAQVRVMTVHQAKGLEFDAVVLPELEYNVGSSRVQCVARRASPTDPPEAMLRYTNKSNWRFLPETWQRAFGAMAAANLTENLCLMYVSLTRPRHGLYMFVSPTTNAKGASQKNAKMLIYNALNCEADPSEPETTWFETGDPLWYESLPSVASRPPRPAPKTIRLQPVPSVPRRNHKE